MFFAMRFFRLVLIALWLTPFSGLFAQNAVEGSVTGIVIDKASEQPVESVAVVLKQKTNGKVTHTAATDSRGVFTIEGVLPGDYVIEYNYIGLASQETPAFTVDAKHATRDLGRLALAESSIRLEKVEISTRKEAFYNSIDRKVFNVGKDLQSLTGSASDLLQNIPSVQVDIEGNVSLRGADNVLILINGKSSNLMGANRSAVLEQLPADAIEKIEVITNPSAKYKPDGTGGIINITLKKKHEAGYSGNVRVTVGNDSRYNAGVTANFNPGKYNVFGMYSIRQDSRPRYNEESRTEIDAITGQPTSTTYQHTEEYARPLSHIARAGVDYQLNDRNKIGGTVDYNYRTFDRHSTVHNLTRDGNGVVTRDYDRLRTDPEYERDLEFTTSYQHSFATEGQELNLEFKHDKTDEQEDNRYSNVYRFPITPTSYDNTLIKNADTRTEAIAEYTQPLGDVAKLETGYSREAEHNDMDFLGSSVDLATGSWRTDRARTNRFIYDSTIHAVYATYGRPIGDFGVSAGLRFEQTYIDTNQVTAGIANKNDYSRLYPTLHTSYNLTENHQLQLNYSHRVRRPESDDLNPYPEFHDTFNLREGNPHLLPEEIHSVEAGYQYKKGEINYLATAYYRHQYHSMTEIKRRIDSATLLALQEIYGDAIDPSALITTRENLAVNRSSGLELAATRSLGGLVSLNLNSNIYRSTIDASDLGYSSSKSAIVWNAKFGADIRASKSTVVQLNSNYTAKRLTPQGYRLPTFVVNLGLRHNFPDKKTAFVFTVSDVFNSLKDRTVVDLPTLHDESTRRRSARIIYAGFIYNFGKATKKTKDDTMQFDNQL
jgi:outer membrane receptor protein involved in Fe transport